MLQVFRESIGRYIAIAILSLIAVTFIFFGIDFSVTGSSFAAKVNGESIPTLEFERQLQDTLNEFQRANRIELTDELRVAIRRDVVEGMVMQEALLQQARDAGYRISDERLDTVIMNDPAFQAGGQYSEDVARSLLVSLGMTPAMYREDMRETLEMQAFRNAVADSAFVTPAEFRRGIELYYEEREIAWAGFYASGFVDQIEAISDDAIAAYHADNEQSFLSEEAVDIEYIELDLATVAESVDISEDDILRAYEEQSELYADSEERRVSHILFEIEGDDVAAAEAEAEQVLERINAGEDFAALAAEFSDDSGNRDNGGDLGWISRGMLPGAFEDTLFAMQTGEIAGPVETSFGVHILRLDNVTATDQPELESVREQLRDELASDEAWGLFLDTADRIDRAAYDQYDDLSGVASQFDLELKTFAGMTRSNAIERFSNPTELVATAFDPEVIASGRNSEMIELNDERVAILRVTGHFPPAPRSIEEVEDQIRDILERDAAAELAAAAASAFAAELETADFEDESFDPAALAEEHGGNWNEAAWIQRDGTSVPASLVTRVFAETRPPEGERSVFSTSLGARDRAVVVLSAVAAGVPSELPSDERDRGQEDFRTQSAAIEINAYASATRLNADVRVPDEILNPDL